MNIGEAAEIAASPSRTADFLKVVILQKAREEVEARRLKSGSGRSVGVEPVRRSRCLVSMGESERCVEPLSCCTLELLYINNLPFRNRLRPRTVCVREQRY